VADSEHKKTVMPSLATVISIQIIHGVHDRQK